LLRIGEGTASFCSRDGAVGSAADDTFNRSALIATDIRSRGMRRDVS
jgi:hypothetical protein